MKKNSKTKENEKEMRILVSGETILEEPDTVKETVIIDYCGSKLEELMDDFPDARYRYKERNWIVPVEKAAEVINRIGWGNVKIDEKLRERIIVVSGKQIIEAPQIPMYLPKREMMEHQIEALAVGASRTRLLLADEQGLGKTKETLDIVEAKYGGKDVKVLIIAPKMLMNVWEEAITDDTNQLYKEIWGPEKEHLIREWLEDKSTRYGITTYDCIINEWITDMLDGKIDVAIVDEIHKCKNPLSKRGKALQRIHAADKIAISGTPIANRMPDLYNTLLWLDVIPEGEHAFEHQYLWYPDNLNKLLEQVMLRRRKEVLNLPEKSYESKRFEMSPRMRELYDDALRYSLEAFDRYLDTTTFLAFMVRVRQIADGMFTGEEDDIKLKMTSEIVENAVHNGEKVVIISCWKAIVEKYMQALSQYNPVYINGEMALADRHEQVERFQNDDECKVIVGTYGTIATGLTLTAGSVMVLVDKPWTPAEVSQAEDRIHRIGTTRPVKIISLTADDSGDTVMEDLLEDKCETIERVVENGNNLRLTKTVKLEILAKMAHTTPYDIERRLKKAS